MTKHYPFTVTGEQLTSWMVRDGLPAWHVSYCAVDADGVPVEWVEAGVATLDQPTIIYLHGGAFTRGSLETVRPPAAELAVVTGARVLSVECATVADGVTAYAWLLGEGLDVDTTTLVSAPTDDGVAAGRLALEEFGLPLPGGARLYDPSGAVA